MPLFWIVRERRHIVSAVSELFVHDRSVDYGPGMHGGVHSQLLHALQLRRVDLVHVGQSPAQALDGMLLVDRLDLVEERINRVVQLRMHVQGQSRPWQSP
jgi:hypothetical protein